MKTISYLEDRYANSLWDVDAIGRAFKQLGVRVEEAHANQIERWLARGTKQLRIGRNISRSSGKAYVVALAWASDSLLFPKWLYCETIPWIYDCWPPQYKAWSALLRRWRIRTAFFSSRTACQFFAERLTGARCYWIPEAIDVENFDHKTQLQNRQVDVLEFGRGYMPLRNMLSEMQAAWQHKIMLSYDKVIFRSRTEFLNAISDARLVVAYPKSLTDPEGSGGLETVTRRYFEIMASGALPIGHCPQELKDLFGYNPVLEIIFARQPRSVVMVDDFQVPGDDGYSFDDYGPGRTLCLDYLAPLREHGMRVFFPTAPSAAETGAKRGSVVLTIDPAIAESLAALPSLRLAAPCGGHDISPPARPIAG